MPSLEINDLNKIQMDSLFNNLPTFLNMRMNKNHI